MTGSEYQRHKESSAAIMREKQKLGMFVFAHPLLCGLLLIFSSSR